MKVTDNRGRLWVLEPQEKEYPFQDFPFYSVRCATRTSEQKLSLRFTDENKAKEFLSLVQKAY